MTRHRPSLSLPAAGALKALGDDLKAARLGRRWSQSALAERLGVSRYTVMSLERGDPSVAVGTVLEAARILGMPIAADEGGRGAPRVLLPLLPRRGRGRPLELDDDF